MPGADHETCFALAEAKERKIGHNVKPVLQVIVVGSREGGGVGSQERGVYTHTASSSS